MSDTLSWVKKADLVLDDLKNNGGLLTPQQNNRFIKKLIDSPTILASARTVPMSSNTQKINKIGIGQRILRRANEGVALTEAERHKVATEQIELNAFEFIAEGRIGYETIEENIEGDAFIQTYLDLVAEQASADIEELIINGDTASPDNYLAAFDGVVKRATRHQVDAAGAPISRAVFNAGYKAMPTAYRKNRQKLKWFMTPNDEADYMEALGDRQTALGDAYTTGAAPLRAMGIATQAAAYLPEGHMFLTNPKNLLVGVRRKFTLESERLISERVIKFVLTCRIAFQIEELDAIVQVRQLGDAADQPA